MRILALAEACVSYFEGSYEPSISQHLLLLSQDVPAEPIPLNSFEYAFKNLAPHINKLRSL